MRFNKTIRHGVAMAFGLGFVPAVQAQYHTVGAYDATPTLGMAINDAASDTGANGITRAAFTTLISSAYAADSGGDIDFEPANNWTGATIPMNTPVTIHYGVSQSQLLTMSRTDLTSGATGWFNTAANWWTSSSNDLAFSGAGNATFTFGSGLADVGISMVPVSGITTSCTLVATLSNLSTVTTSTEFTGSTNSAIFFGISAPSGTTITALSFIDSGALPGAINRYDDLGFVAAPAPEPVSAVLLGLGAMALLRRRKP